MMNTEETERGSKGASGRLPRYGAPGRPGCAPDREHGVFAGRSRDGEKMDVRLKNRLTVVLAAAVLSGSFGTQTFTAPVAAAEKAGVGSSAAYSASTEPAADYMVHGCSSGAEMSIKRSHAVYYMAAHSKEPENYYNGVVRKIVLKKKKVISYGSFMKSPKMSLSGASYCRNKKRTFRLAKNVKFYSRGGNMGKRRQSKRYIKSLCRTANGLQFILKVKNGKVTEIIFSS